MKDEVKDNPNSKGFDPYRRGRSLWTEYLNTRDVYTEKTKMSFVDLFVYRWYKNYVEPRFDTLKHPPIIKRYE